MRDDIRETVAPLIDAAAKAWDQLLRQVDEILRWSPGPPPGTRSPAAMTDGELLDSLGGVAFGLFESIDPAQLAASAAAGDPRWRFNLPVTVETLMRSMFLDGSHAFSLAVTGLKDHASTADLAAVGRLADILVRARWLVEPLDSKTRRERGFALAADTIRWLRVVSERAAAASDAEPSGLAGDIADRAATMTARLAELRHADGLGPAAVPKRRELFERYLPQGGLTLFGLTAAAGSRPGVAPSALFYPEPGTGDALEAFQRLALTRGYWLAEALALYADLCACAAPVLGRGDWEEIIATAEGRFRPLADEAARRYRQRLQRGLHPGL